MNATASAASAVSDCFGYSSKGFAHESNGKTQCRCSIYTCIMYVQTVMIVFCEVNMSCFQNVASILVLEDRCRKGFRNVSGTLTVILKFC